MADDIQTTPGTGSDPRVATNDKGGRHVQIVQLDLGNDSTVAELTAGQRAAAASLPVVLASDQPAVTVSDGGGSLTVDGAVTVSGTVTASAGTGPWPITDNNGSLTVDGTVAATQSGAWTVTANAGSGTFAVGDGGASLTVDGTVAATKSGAWTLDANSGVDIGDVTVNNAAGAGAVNIQDGGNSITVDGTVNAAQSGTWSVTVNTALPAGTNNIGNVDVVTLPALPAGSNTIGSVGLAPQASGGLSISRTISAATTNATSVKASAGQVFGIYAHNTNAAVRYLKLYNKASAPTVGTDTPVMTLPIPGNTAGAGFVLEQANGIAFGTGIALALTTGVADSDTGAVAANEIVVNLLYK